MFELHGRRYDHVFEGDAATTAVCFDGCQATGACRILESAALRRERARGKMLYGISAPLRQRVRRPFKNTGNTNLMRWQGQLLALVESSLPQRVEPSTLRSTGETSLGGVIRGSFSAHPHRVPARRAIYNFGLRVVPRPSLELYECPDTGPARRLGSLPLDCLPLIHDFMVTDHYLIFFVCPVRIHPVSAIARGEFHKLFQWKAHTDTQVLVVPIDAPQKATRFSAPPFWNWHFANAFEDDGRLVADLVKFEDFRLFAQLRVGGRERIQGGQLVRATFRPDGGPMSWDPLFEEACVFPQGSTDSRAKETDHIFVQLWGARTGIARVSPGGGPALVWEAKPFERVSEPVEAGAYLLTLVYDSTQHQSYIAVLRAADPSQGPICRAWFDHHVPMTFHGTWVPAES